MLWARYWPAKIASGQRDLLNTVIIASQRVPHLVERITANDFLIQNTSHQIGVTFLAITMSETNEVDINLTSNTFQKGSHTMHVDFHFFV